MDSKDLDPSMNVNLESKNQNELYELVKASTLDNKDSLLVGIIARIDDRELLRKIVSLPNIDLKFQFDAALKLNDQKTYIELALGKIDMIDPGFSDIDTEINAMYGLLVREINDSSIISEILIQLKDPIATDIIIDHIIATSSFEQFFSKHELQGLFEEIDYQRIRIECLKSIIDKVYLGDMIINGIENTIMDRSLTKYERNELEDILKLKFIEVYKDDFQYSEFFGKDI
jgi:hypothetical protein